ncbi:HAD family phosphatase [Nocardia sp. NPDC051463]|uniref:HAD family hydrolase n=1 Tax=Nocardia sp. NPDC051463 TaxID=3154845 RepID=UPI00344FB8D0
MQASQRARPTRSTERTGVIPSLRPPTAARGLIFDFDGTLVDSDVLNFHALNYALNQTSDRSDLQVTFGWFMGHSGLSLEDALCILTCERVAAIDLGAVRVARENYLLTHLDELAVRDEVAAIADSYQHHPCAIGTGGNAAVVRPALHALGLSHLFDVVITRDDVTAGKPSPEIFLRAADALGLPAHLVHVYEDTAEGLAAAAAAGMTATDVRSPTIEAAECLTTLAPLNVASTDRRKP